MTRSYQRTGLVLRRRGMGSDVQIRELQWDLRQLGYLKNGIDGVFGGGTERAVKVLQYDLLNNDGSGHGDDGEAPVRVLDYNRGRVVDVTGEADQGTLACLVDMADDPGFPKLPHVEDAVAENGKILGQILSMPAGDVPIPFLLAIIKQESNLRHFNEPRPGDEDTFIVTGLDTNASQRYIITSRGYGAGQYTLFHHPPRAEEISDFMLDVSKNLTKALRELRNKFDYFVNGPTSGTRADDRLAEVGNGPLRVCKYVQDDPRYLRDCKNCLRQAGDYDITGQTPLYEGAATLFRPTQYYRKAAYARVPVRRNIPCDWPYAVRRYNGAGINSYHYQVRILKYLEAL